MIIRVAGLAAGLLALSAPAYALQECKPGKEDSRIRYCTYSSGQVYHIWTAPGGTITIHLADDETIPEGNIAVADGSRLDRHVRGNFVVLKNTAKTGDTPCMVPEPLTIISLRSGEQRRAYHFQLETRPSDCSETPAEQMVQRPGQGLSLASTAEAMPRPPTRSGNLKYIGENGLGAGADVFYAAVFQYPDDEVAKRRAAWRARHADDDKRDAQQRLKQQVSWPYGNKFDGSWNYRYAAHGNLTAPAELRDNGYQTIFVFPQMERVPSLFRWNPGADHCNRSHDDHNESTVIPSVHRSGADGDTIIAAGTAQGWCLRDGQTVLEIRNFGYTLTGATPATGTVSPSVRRVLKGEEPESEATRAPVPLAPAHAVPQETPNVVH